MSPKIRSIAAIALDQTNSRTIWLISAISLIGIALIYLSLRDLSQRESHTRVVSEAPRQPTFYVSETASLGLNVERQGDDLILLWNRDAPAISSGVTGILVIQTGDNQEEFILNSHDLHTGRYTYRSPANQLNVRLHVFDANDRQTNDSAVFSVAPESNPDSVASPPLTAHSAVSGQPSLTTARRRTEFIGSADRAGDSLHSELIVPRSRQSDVAAAQLGEPPKAGSSLSGLRTPSSIEPLSSLLPPAVVAGTLTESPTYLGSLPVVGEASSVSPARRIVTSIPFVKKLLHNPDFVPPTPSLSPMPKIPDNLLEGLKRAVSIDVRVFVDAEGNVQYSELLTNGTGSDREIASLAVFESRRWKFHPALMRGKPRDAEVILRYQFRPETLTSSSGQ